MEQPLQIYSLESEAPTFHETRTDLPKENPMMSNSKKKVALLVGAALLTVGTTGCKVTKTQDGQMPDVEVSTKGGQLPKYDVKTPTVAVGSEKRDVNVPTVKTEKREIKVPTVDVKPPK
jgi:hypothetical protein